MSGAIKINGTSSGSTTITAPASGGDRTLTAPDSDGTLATQAYAATAGGLVLVDSQTVSAASTVVFDSVFSGVYENYVLLINASSSASGTLKVNFRSAGVTNTSANYNWITFNIWSAGSGPAATTNTTYAGVGLFSGYSASEIKLFGPALTAPTGLSSQTGRAYNGTALETNLTTAGYSASTAFDGIAVSHTAGNLTGTLCLYGYAK